MSVEICFSPNKIHLSEIESWLIDEVNKNNEGFYCNWSTIVRSFNDNKICTIIVDGVVAGFITYRIGDFVADIDIAEIKPNMRSLGYGRILIETLLNKLKKDGILVVQLYCSPQKSELAWSKMGFVRNLNVNEDPRIWMYIVLVKSLPLSYNIKSSDIIQLWDKEPHLCYADNYKWQWCVEYEINTQILSKPIIFPAHYDWQMSRIKGDVTIACDKVKRFTDRQIDEDGFIIIRELPLL